MELLIKRLSVMRVAILLSFALVVPTSCRTRQTAVTDTSHKATTTTTETRRDTIRDTMWLQAVTKTDTATNTVIKTVTLVRQQTNSNNNTRHDTTAMATTINKSNPYIDNTQRKPPKGLLIACWLRLLLLAILVAIFWRCARH